MSRGHLIWGAKCLLLCVAGIFVAGRVSDLLNPLVWWVLHRNGTTVAPRSMFVGTYYLPLVCVYGFALGLVPARRLLEFVAASLGRLRYRSVPSSEFAWGRPLLWAWAPVGLVFAFRFLTYSAMTDRSVLGATSWGPSRWEHFFAPLSLTSAYEPVTWLFDRLVLTGPTAFLIAYTAAVFLRSQLPDAPSRPDEVSR